MVAWRLEPLLYRQHRMIHLTVLPRENTRYDWNRSGACSPTASIWVRAQLDHRIRSTCRMSYDEVHEMFPDTWSSGHAACRCCPLSIPRATSKSHAAARYFVYVKKFLKKFFYGTALFWTATGNTESRRFQSDPGQQFSGWTMEYYCVSSNVSLPQFQARWIPIS